MRGCEVRECRGVRVWVAGVREYGDGDYLADVAVTLVWSGVDQNWLEWGKNAMSIFDRGMRCGARWTGESEMGRGGVIRSV